MLKTNFNKFSGNSKEDTYKIIIDNEGSRSRVNQAEKFKKKNQTVSSKCCRILIEGCNPRKILKWTEKSSADFILSNISRKHLTS